MSYGGCFDSRSGTSFPDTRQDAIDELIVQKHPGSNEFLDQRSGALDVEIFFARRTTPSVPMTGTL